MRSIGFWLLGMTIVGMIACIKPDGLFRMLTKVAIRGRGEEEESGRNWFLSLSLRGRLPTLPLSQYHRRGEA